MLRGSLVACALRHTSALTIQAVERAHIRHARPPDAHTLRLRWLSSSMVSRERTSYSDETPLTPSTSTPTPSQSSPSHENHTSHESYSTHDIHTGHEMPEEWREAAERLKRPADYQYRNSRPVQFDPHNPIRMAFVAGDTDNAQQALEVLKDRYKSYSIAEADVIVALGGDGLMLQTLHANISAGKPIYGMNRGSVGFLMNDYSVENLEERLRDSRISTIHPLKMVARTRDGKVHTALAINEVSLFRETRQAAKIRILVDGRVRLPELICDGVLVATPAGSTAYNLSAHGPVLPLDAGILALTPISAFRPRRWHGALLPRDARVRFITLDPEKRPVSVVADDKEMRGALDVLIEEDRSVALSILCDPERTLDERIIAEQFVPQ